MAQGRTVQRLGQFVSALIIGAGMLMSVAAVRTLALGIDIGNLPAGTTCVRVSVNFRECTTPDGTKYWCTDDGTCEKAPKRVVPVTNIRPVGGLLANTGDVSSPPSAQPLEPVSGLTLIP